MQGWFKIKGAAGYSDLSPRTMRALLKQGLPYSRLPSGTVLISREALDDFFSRFEVRENQVDQIVDEVVRDFIAEESGAN